MRLIPGKTKVGLELFKGISLMDMAVYAVAILLAVLALCSNLPRRLFIALGVLVLGGFLTVRLDDEPVYLLTLHVLRHFRRPRFFGRFAEKGTETEPKAAAQPSLSRAARKAEENARKQKKLEEDKLLKAEDTPEEVKAAIREERKKAYAEAAAKLAQAKDAAIKRENIDVVTAFTDIRQDMIEYGKAYKAAVLEIPPLEFRFFSNHRRQNSIENGLGRLLRSVRSSYGVNIVKIDRPINYETYLDNEYKKLDELRASYENGFIAEEELKTRVEIMYDRIGELENLCTGHQVVEAFYYIVLFDSDAQQLNTRTAAAMEMLMSGEMHPRRLNNQELALFLRYTNEIDFDEHELDSIPPEQYAQWAKPKLVDVSARTVQVNRMMTHNAIVSQYPSAVDDCWLATVMSIIGTKVVIKCRPMDNGNAIHSIDQSLQELRSRQNSTGVDSKRIELQNHIDTLTTLLDMLQGDNELLLNCNIYVTEYDLARTRSETGLVQPPMGSLRTLISDMKRTIRRSYSEKKMKLNYLEFNQLDAFIGSQVSGYDPFSKSGRGIPSNSIAAGFPWIFAHVSDEHGIKMGSADGIPVFINFFRRDSERVNSNMVIVGKSGSGKSYATKSLLSNLAADDAKIFILDPENEYSELAVNLHGKFINVGNAQYGRLNPFHIITTLDDDESEGGETAGSYATHLQFLEEFFKQILPDCDKDALEYLNSMIDRMYVNHGITDETDLSRLRPEDFPIFDDLYDTILQEFQSNDNDYIRSMLRKLMNYVSKFAAGGRNAAIWDGPSSITTAENFTVFNFQSLLANRNGTIANAQMLLVLKYIDNEIIKNRDYNTKYGLKRKVVVVIDEAHVFIDAKYPVALDFMFQLAKRIRKYNGMQIVITQNIKDFVGSEEIARKSTAIINACQYSFIFALAPNDMDDLCKLYEKAGGINENEQEEIVSAPRGHAFTVMGAQSRSSFLVEVPKGIETLFQEQKSPSRYFYGARGDLQWTEFIQESRKKRDANMALKPETEIRRITPSGSSVQFEEIPDPDYRWTIPPAEESEAEPAPVENSRIDFYEVSKEELAASAPVSSERRAATLTKPFSEGQTDDRLLSLLEAVSLGRQGASEETRQLGSMVSELSRMVENLSRLSYEGIEDKIRSIVAASAPQVTSSLEPSLRLDAVSEQPVEEVIDGDRKRLDDTVPVDIPQSAPIAAVEAEAEPEKPPEEGSSLMNLLLRSFKQTQTQRERSEIEMMETYGETVMDISLEQLAKYIASLSASV